MLHQQVTKNTKISPEEFLEGYRYIEQSMRQAKTFKEAIHHTLKYFDRKLFSTFSSMLIVDQDRKHFREGISNSLPCEFLDAYVGMRIEDGVSSSQSAAYTGEIQITANIEKNPPGQAYSDLASRYRLNSCWAFPIFDYQQEETIAIFSIYSRESRTPTQHEIDVVRSFTSMLSLLVSNYIQSEQAKVEFSWIDEIKEPSISGDESYTNEVLNAIENEEIIPFYQPLYQVDRDDIYGFEALARWEHPIRGTQPPSDFIEYAEEHQFIDLIDDVIFKKACLDIKHLMDRYETDFVLSINVSALHINQPEFAKKIKKTLADTEFPSNYLAIEITETALMESLGNVSKTIEKLKDMGVQISIDDFGTSYSSLNYLKYLSVDMIKLDRSFVQDVVNNPVDQRICKTIIQLAKDLNLNILAEGIETKSHFDLIRTFGCKIFQGFYFSKPISFEDVRNKLDALHV